MSRVEVRWNIDASAADLNNKRRVRDTQLHEPTGRASAPVVVLGRAHALATAERRDGFVRIVAGEAGGPFC